MSDTVQAWDVAGTEFIGGRRDPNETYRAKRYDFKRPDKFSLEQIRTVEIIHETITRRLESVVSTRIGRRADVSIHTVDQLNFAEFLASIPDRSAFAVVELPPLLGSMLLQIDGSLAALLANAALGQSPQTLALATPTRTFTELDAITLHSVVDEFIPAVRDGWRNAIEISPAIAAIETEARHAQIVPPTEMIILGSCRVGIEGEGAFINFAIPYLTIEPIIDRLSPKYWYSKVRSVPGSGLFGERTHDLPVDCELSVPAGRVALSSLPLILDGEPLPLPSLRKQTVDLRAGGVTVARLRASAGELGAEVLELPVVARLGGRGGSVGDAHEGGAVAEALARLEPRLRSLEETIRGVRIAVEELRDSRDAVLVDRDDTFDRAATGRAPDIENADDVALLTSGESAATVAFLLAALDRAYAARILSALPAELRDAAVRALTTLDSADLGLHARLLGAVGRKIHARRDSRVAGGPVTAAEILNHVPTAVEKEVMDRFIAEDKELFESIAQLMFVFEDFILLDAATVRKVADRVEPEELALAMKGVVREVSSHILSALGDEQAAAIERAETSLGRVRRQDVDEARRAIIEELRLLEKAGEVVVARPEDVVE